MDSGKQIKALRDQINAAHNVGDTQKADALQAQLHVLLAAQADAFVTSAAGRKHMDRLMERA